MCAAKYVLPVKDKDGFNCPHCDAYSHQIWFNGLGFRNNKPQLLNDLTVSICERCQNFALWIGEKMVYPVASMAPLPAEDLPANVKDDYIEARNIVNASPRGASALLRLSMQKLMPHLDEKGVNLDDDIRELVKKGLPITIQQSLDCVRVIGNNAVHPGEIDLKDDIETAKSLFDLVNLIVEYTITKPKQVEKIYSRIPKGAKDAIEKKDNIANLTRRNA
jgi:hypothetical protein